MMKQLFVNRRMMVLVLFVLTINSTFSKITESCASPYYQITRDTKKSRKLTQGMSRKLTGSDEDYVEDSELLQKLVITCGCDETHGIKYYNHKTSPELWKRLKHELRYFVNLWLMIVMHNIAYVFSSLPHRPNFIIENVENFDIYLNPDDGNIIKDNNSPFRLTGHLEGENIEQEITMLCKLAIEWKKENELINDAQYEALVQDCKNDLLNEAKKPPAKPVEGEDFNERGIAFKIDTRYSQAGKRAVSRSFYLIFLLTGNLTGGNGTKYHVNTYYKEVAPGETKFQIRKNMKKTHIILGEKPDFELTEMYYRNYHVVENQWATSCNAAAVTVRRSVLYFASALNDSRFGTGRTSLYCPDDYINYFPFEVDDGDRFSIYWDAWVRNKLRNRNVGLRNYRDNIKTVKQKKKPIKPEKLTFFIGKIRPVEPKVIENNYNKEWNCDEIRTAVKLLKEKDFIGEFRMYIGMLNTEIKDLELYIEGDGENCTIKTKTFDIKVRILDGKSKTRCYMLSLSNKYIEKDYLRCISNLEDSINGEAEERQITDIYQYEFFFKQIFLDFIYYLKEGFLTYHEAMDIDRLFNYLLLMYIDDEMNAENFAKYISNTTHHIKLASSFYPYLFRNDPVQENLNVKLRRNYMERALIYKKGTQYYLKENWVLLLRLVQITIVEGRWYNIFKINPGNNLLELYIPRFLHNYNNEKDELEIYCDAFKEHKVYSKVESYFEKILELPDLSAYSGADKDLMTLLHFKFTNFPISTSILLFAIYGHDEENGSPMVQVIPKEFNEADYIFEEEKVKNIDDVYLDRGPNKNPIDQLNIIKYEEEFVFKRIQIYEELRKSDNIEDWILWDNEEEVKAELGSFIENVNIDLVNKTPKFAGLTDNYDLLITEAKYNINRGLTSEPRLARYVFGHKGMKRLITFGLFYTNLYGADINIFTISTLFFKTEYILAMSNPYDLLLSFNYIINENIEHYKKLNERLKQAAGETFEFTFDDLKSQVKEILESEDIMKVVTAKSRIICLCEDSENEITYCNMEKSLENPDKTECHGEKDKLKDFIILKRIDEEAKTNNYSVEIIGFIESVWVHHENETDNQAKKVEISKENIKSENKLRHFTSKYFIHKTDKFKRVDAIKELLRRSIYQHIQSEKPPN